MEATTLTDLDRRLDHAHRDVAAAMGRLFDVVAEADDLGTDEIRYSDVPSWLRWSLGLSARTSRLWVRTAAALQELPAIRAAFAVGAISFDQLQVLLRAATPENDEQLLALAATHDLEDLTQEIRDIERQQENEQEAEAASDVQVLAGPFAKTWWRDDVLHVRAEIPGVDGVMFETALTRLSLKAPKDGRSGIYRDIDVLSAEALVQMASESLADDRDHDRATLVVHVSAVDLANRSGEGWDAARRCFEVAELDRLACDARLQPAVDDPSGVTVGVGRTTRKIEPWLRRLVAGRDQGCRFPGCARKRWLNIHHLTPWAQGGPTNLDNLASLCGFHHRLVHEAPFTIEGNPNRELTFYDKWGSVHRPVREKFPPDWDRIRLKHLDRYRDAKLAELADIAQARAGP